MLSDKERALLNSKLYVPLAVRELVESTETVQDDLHYALHEVISDFQPDTALICIALTAQYIAGSYKGQKTATLQTLALECERIIEDYGFLWLQNAQNTQANPEMLFDTLIHVPEDLESLSELLGISVELLRSQDTKSAEILEILQTQAEAHGFIAQHFLDVIDEQATVNETVTPPIYTDNVIQFPTLH